MTLSKALVLALAAQVSSVWGHLLRVRDTGDPYPICSPATNANCIDGGRYLMPELNYSLEGDAGDTAYVEFLPNHTFTISQWSAGRMPEPCYRWGVTADHWVVTDFVMYNVTFSDCSTPFVVCWNKYAPKSISEIATYIGRIPAGMRQSTSMYLIYGDKQSDNPSYTGYIATLAADAIIVGRSEAYFTTALVHETGHAVDSNLASPNAPHPGTGTSFSSTSTWKNAADKDGYAVSAYGAGSYVEDFAETGRAVLLDNTYPGGLRAWSGNNPNLTQITHQLAAFQAVAGRFYVTGSTCDSSHKFPFPTSIVTYANSVTPSPVGSTTRVLFYSADQRLSSTHLLGSLGPDDGACTVYSDAACSKPISGLEGFQNPGNSNLPASNIDSYLCINPVLSSVGSGKLYICPKTNWIGSCRDFSWDSWVCQTLPSTYKNSIGSLGPDHGNCWFYR
ncbi:hypothetical protein VE00_05137 [Pseudogymnoascus sp. WSF 3629]|nr:hypothetical protein VE00_05137 [Pseudogymnoascus sp. WSF 3629]